MTDDILIKVDGVSKKFCRSLKKSLWYGVKDIAAEATGQSGRHNRLRPEEFWAVDTVSFEVKRGDCLGVIGRNGAGKTTLLKMLNGLIKPDKGRIKMRGRVGALIALGAGFNPILTGRENIYVNGSILGLSKREIDNKIEEIIDFSEIGDFIDAPVQSYSSGMHVRLGFAVATALTPDILLLDEVLAVGDTLFRAKCLQRIKDVQHSGGAILLVTHTLEHVAHFCNRAILLNKGILAMDGDASTTLATYMQDILTNIDNTDNTDNTATNISNISRTTNPNSDDIQNHPNYSNQETRWGDRSATIERISLMQNGIECCDALSKGTATDLILDVCFHAEIDEPIYGLSFKTLDGGIIFNTNSRQLMGVSGVPKQTNGDKVSVCFSFVPFLDSGEYLISLGVASETPQGIQAHDRRYDAIKINVSMPVLPSGDIDMQPIFRILKSD